MGQGDYTHPSYLTRQHAEFGPTTAGASGTSCHAAYPSNLRFRQVICAVAIAGTIGTNVGAVIQANGTGILQYTSTGVTTSTGVVALGTIGFGTAGNTIGSIASIADINTMVPANSVISVKNGLDATAVTNLVLEYYLDPSATWTGNSN
jgi:hypothetical protein